MISHDSSVDKREIKAMWKGFVFPSKMAAKWPSD